jgi:amino acid transporter
MRYVNSTPSQVARVVGGWILGVGFAAFSLTFGELGAIRPPTGAIVSIVVAAVGGLIFSLATIRHRVADQVNRRFFSENAGTDVLASRRRFQSTMTKTRTVLLLVLVATCAWWIVLASTANCIGQVCSGFLSNQNTWIDTTRIVAVILGLTTLAVASLVRLHGVETDRWEELASDALRRRDDGPVPGLKHSRWE